MPDRPQIRDKSGSVGEYYYSLNPAKNPKKESEQSDDMKDQFSRRSNADNTRIRDRMDSMKQDPKSADQPTPKRRN